MSDTKIVAPPGTQEVTITFTIHAPREVVFRTITDPQSIPKWWGPSRLTTAVHKMMVMPGGMWRFVQQDEHGKDYAFHGVYHDIVIPERLVYTSEFEGTPGNVTVYTDTFEEKNGDTIITSKAVFQSVEDRDQKMKWGLEEGANAITDRLNELLAPSAIGERKDVSMIRNRENEECITITRLFDAPREEVWERWMDPNQYMCWWGPKDFTSPTARLDFREGGKFLSHMRGPDGKDYYDTGTYEEIDNLHHIVYTDSFADENGNPVPPSYYGMGSDEPLEMAVEVTLQDMGDKTQLTIQHCGFPGGDMSQQAKEGWNQSFDKLERCLSL